MKTLHQPLRRWIVKTMVQCGISLLPQSVAFLPDGVMCHRIGLADQFASFDRLRRKISCKTRQSAGAVSIIPSFPGTDSVIPSTYPSWNESVLRSSRKRRFLAEWRTFDASIWHVNFDPIASRIF